MIIVKLKKTPLACVVMAIFIMLTPLVMVNVASGTVVTATMTVTVPVMSSCAVSATRLAFGNYNPLSSTPLNAQSNILVTCSNHTPFSVALNQGTSGGTVSTRKMLGSPNTNTLSYTLSQTSARTDNWGNTTGNMATGTSSGAAITFIVYGQIPVGQNSAPGSYSDTITVSVLF